MGWLRRYCRRLKRAVCRYPSRLDILYALSYGCRVLLEVLADQRLTITTTIADGMSTHDYPNITSKLGKEIFLFFFTGFFYQMMGKAGPIRKKLIAKLTGRKPEEAERLLYPDATLQSWKNQDACLIGRPMFFLFLNTINNSLTQNKQFVSNSDVE